MKWRRVKNSEAEKELGAGSREYANHSSSMKTSRTILVYDDSELGYDWRVWKGNTRGNCLGKYQTFNTQREAIHFANQLMKRRLK